MRFGIVYRGQDAGWVAVDADARGMSFQAESAVHTSAVLRLYGLTQAGAPLRIGVLEPENGVLRLNRRLTRETLRAAGVEQPPEQYYLEDGQPGCRPASAAVATEPRAPAGQGHHGALSGDPLLSRALRAGAASLVREGDMCVIRAPFAPGRAHPLHFALTACVIEQAADTPIAVLRKRDGAKA